MVLIPLLHGPEPVGVLKAYSAMPHNFSQADVQVLALISEMIGSIIYFSTALDHQDLLYKATHDYLTGVFNRSEFMDRLRREITLNQRKPREKYRHFGIIIADMDGLKQVNDTHGHLAGDALIREFAHRCQSIIGKSDTLARLGGDEFAILLSPLESPRDIVAAMRDLRSVLEPSFIWQDTPLGLSTSFGASRFPRDGIQIPELLEAADFRMYRRKRSKGNDSK
jgi:diguanylate cyclase (GGDEF)-like protein